jgi:hypothetical protein
MGPPKCFKTGSVVGTYPRPLLVLNFDSEGLDVIKDPISPIAPEVFEAQCKEPLKDGIYVVDFCDQQQKVMMETYAPQAATKPFKDFIETVNKLVRVGCPWKTVVIDSVTGLGDVILAHIASTNSSSLGSALKWAPMIGGKIHQCMGVCAGLNAHVVFIFHSSSPSKNEETSEISVAPLVPSQWMRDRAGSLVSQYFYQCIEGGKPMLYTKDNGYVRGIGARWPSDLPLKVAPDFNSIYGKAL